MRDARSFERLVLSHLDSAYNLARWLLRDEASAEDVVQESALRAWRYIGSLRGDQAKAWFLGIVRNACFTHLARVRDAAEDTGLDDDAFDALCEVAHAAAAAPAADPAQALDRWRERALIDAAIRNLPPGLREVIVLREFEDMAYADIAQVASLPIGTVMSRLSRARQRLKAALVSAGIDR